MTKYNGACVCGAITISLEGKPEKTVVCYCSDCRKNSGHLGQIIAAYDKEKVQIGDPDSQLRDYLITKTGSGKPKTKEFCGRCGCTIRTILESVPGKYLVRLSLLDHGFPDFVPENKLFPEVKTAYVGGAACDI